MIKVLHFADAHIDMVNYGRHDPQTGLPLRVLDFLKSLDTIVDTAIEEQVDLVIFAGDAYKDRNPAPTFQREWGRRMMRLSRADIRTVLLVGNHDYSPALGRAHAMESFDTLAVPNIWVIEKPSFLKPEDLNGLPVQILALPWLSRSGLLASGSADPENVYEEMGIRLTELVHGWLNSADPALPRILTAHASVEGAKYGSERTVMLGKDLTLSGSLVRDPRLDYVALGHIHKAQNLNEANHPPVLYSGSIERVDFGEAQDEKYFMIANVDRGHTEVEWRRLNTRPFVDRFLHLESSERITERILDALPTADKLNGVVLRLTIEYPREFEPLIDEQAIRRHAEQAFEFQLSRRPEMEARLRLPEDQTIGSLTPMDLLEKYWKAMNVEADERQELARLASGIIHQSTGAE